MEDNNIKENVAELINDLKLYASNRSSLLSLQMKKIASELIASLGSSLILLMLASLLFIFGSFALAYYISEVYNSVFIGFITVTIIYFVLFIFTLIFKNNIKNYISNTIIKILFKEDEHENDQE